MKTISLALVFMIVAAFGSDLYAQDRNCPDGKCSIVQYSSGTIVLDPLKENLTVEAARTKSIVPTQALDRFDQVIRATVRVTVSNVCGSGTIVGRTPEGNAIVLTNAHVAGTTRGRVVNVERWNTNGVSERSTATIIASGYGKGTSVDFALLKCNLAFAKDVDPIPIADRYPNTQSLITTFGCPRCEWPSLQVLRLNRKEGQLLSWKPEAIGGRSGSSIVDYSEDGPRVVGLLTWAGGGEGLGQSTPFLLSAMRGKLPATTRPVRRRRQMKKSVTSSRPRKFNNVAFALQRRSRSNTVIRQLDVEAPPPLPNIVWPRLPPDHSYLLPPG